MAVEELARMPAVAPLMRRAVTGAIGRSIGPRRGPHQPDDGEAAAGTASATGPAIKAAAGAEGVLAAQLLVRDVGVDVDHLARYAHVCGFQLSNVLPPTYLHVMAFALNLDLMTRADFPFALLGLVHTGNTIEHLRALDVSERFDFAVRTENLRPHERGRAIDVVTEAMVDGEVVWRERSAYLRKSRVKRSSPGGAGSAGGTGAGKSGNATAESATSAAPPSLSQATAVWRVPASVGRAYAGISGDRNPIHTSAVAARLFGFPRPIAHGMWSVARCLAALTGRVPDAFMADVTFKLPVLLPATVVFTGAERSGGGWQISLHDAKTGKPHLAGVVAAASTR